MCFSAEADFVSGAVIGAIGVATLSQVEKPREVPLRGAADGVRTAPDRRGLRVARPRRWRDPDHRAGRVRLPAVRMGVPAGVRAVRDHAVGASGPQRGADSRGSSRSGRYASAYLAASLLTGDVSAHSGGNVVLYGGGGRYADAATALYIIATCGAPLCSRHRTIVWFGIANIVAVVVIAVVQGEGLTSIWCLLGHGRQRAHLLADSFAWRRAKHRLPGCLHRRPRKVAIWYIGETDRHLLEGRCQSAETSR